MSVQETESKAYQVDSAWEIADDLIDKAEKLFRTITTHRGSFFHPTGQGRIDLVIQRGPQGEVLTTTHERQMWDLTEAGVSAPFWGARKLCISSNAGRLVVTPKDYDIRAEAAIRRQLFELGEPTAPEANPDAPAEVTRLRGLLGTMHHIRYQDIPVPEANPDPIVQCGLASELEHVLYMAH